MERYVQVSREAMITALERAGFGVDADPMNGGELVYIRQHHLDPTMYVKVYTTLGVRGGDVRAKGADAIRVLLIFRNEKSGKSGCLYKATKVLRTGTEAGVIERTLERAREAYADGNRRVLGQTKHGKK